MSAILRDGLLERVQRWLHFLHLDRRIRYALGRYIMITGRLPAEHEVMHALVGYACEQAARRTVRRTLTAWRFYRLGWRLGRWLRDRDTHVLIGCAVLIGVYCEWVAR